MRFKLTVLASLAAVFVPTALASGQEVSPPSESPPLIYTAPRTTQRPLLPCCSPARASVTSHTTGGNGTPSDPRVGQLTNIVIGMDREITRLNGEVTQLRSQLGRTVEVVSRMDQHFDSRVSSLEQWRTHTQVQMALTDARLTALEQRYGSPGPLPTPSPLSAPTVSPTPPPAHVAWGPAQVRRLDEILPFRYPDPAQRSEVRMRALQDAHPASYLLALEQTIERSRTVASR
jgi:hypothetical protein